MYLVLNLRSRILQFTILGLIFLSFYTYYYTATNEIHQLAILATGSQPSSNVIRMTLNTSKDIQGMTSLVKEATLEPTSLNTSSHNTNSISNYSPITTLSTLISSQSLVLSNISKNIEQPVAKRLNESRNASESIATTFNKDSAGAIYQTGHSISIPEKCPEVGANLELIILIMSAPMHFEARTAIRQTWGHFGQRKDMSIAFLLGNIIDSSIDHALSREQDMYGDIIYGRFIDSYSNLTLKSISALEWVRNYCSKVKYFLKTDDDMFINVPRLLSFINKHSKDRNVIFGRLARKWKPIRNKKSKYYVSRLQYKPEVFPDFTTGPAYLMSGDVIPKLYEESLKYTYLKLEDVFITGVVAHGLGIKRTQANEFLNKRISFNSCNVQRSISIHMVKYSEQFDLWKKLLDGKSKCK